MDQPITCDAQPNEQSQILLAMNLLAENVDLLEELPGAIEKTFAGVLCPPPPSTAVPEDRQAEMEHAPHTAALEGLAERIVVAISKAQGLLDRSAL